MDLKAFYDFHCQSDALATLAVRNRETSRYLQFDNDNILSGWRNNKTGEVKKARQAIILQDWAFSGIHVISPEIFNSMPPEDKFSIIDVYLKAAQSRKIIAYPHDEDIWLDVGKPEAIKRAGELLILHKTKF